MISSGKKEYIRNCQPEGSKRRWYVIRSIKRSFKEEILLITQLKFSHWHFTNFCVSPKTFSKLAKFIPWIGKTGVRQDSHNSFVRWTNWEKSPFPGRLTSLFNEAPWRSRWEREGFCKCLVLLGIFLFLLLGFRAAQPTHLGHWLSGNQCLPAWCFLIVIFCILVPGKTKESMFFLGARCYN